MTKRVIGLHLAGWVVGFLILVISLASAIKLGSDQQQTASGRGWYWSEVILPDHVIYPLIMVVDRLALETNQDQTARVYIQVNYAYRRLTAAQALVAKQKHNLALTTLTKAQKYLNQAAQGALDNQVSVADRRMVIRAIENQNKVVLELVPSFTTFDQGVLNHLRQESEILEEKLMSSLE
jgi:hypothetical protein